MANSVVKMIIVGDVQPDRDAPKTLFAALGDHFGTADLRMCQLECVISDQGTVRTDVRNPAHRVHPRNIEALTAAPFDIVTYAGNNNLDYGVEGFVDTIDRLNKAGIAVVGAGANIEEARKPTVVSRNGVRIAVVDSCSILRDGYAATPSRPGISPLHVYTFYQPLENVYEQPGTPARTVTVADHADSRAMRDAVAEARDTADVVIACFHWGVHFTYDLAMYQADLGYEAIDAGADLVIGTHPHCLQAIDVYRGKYIFYSLGNFAFEQRKIASTGVAEYLSFYGIPMDVGGPNPHPAHCRMSCLLRCKLSKQGVDEARILPTYLTDRGIPEVQKPGTEKYTEIAELLRRLCHDIGTEIEEVGDGSLQVRSQKASPLDTRNLLRDRKISYPYLRELARG